jgi:hypothetical protein
MQAIHRASKRKDKDQSLKRKNSKKTVKRDFCPLSAPLRPAPETQ